jgi:hypothetical protein
MLVTIYGVLAVFTKTTMKREAADAAPQPRRDTGKEGLGGLRRSLKDGK